jgi:hypothetical protein
MPFRYQEPNPFPYEKIKVPANLARSTFDHKNLAREKPSPINKLRSSNSMPVMDTATKKLSVGNLGSSPMTVFLCFSPGYHSGPEFRKKGYMTILGGRCIRWPFQQLRQSIPSTSPHPALRGGEKGVEPMAST